MKVFIASDHAGFEAKNLLKKTLAEKYELIDLGPDELAGEDDYPVYARKVAEAVGANKSARGLLLCGSGQGMAIAANKFTGIRAAVAWNEAVAIETRTDNDSNVLSLPARFLDQAGLIAVAQAWLEADFSGAERHRRRIDQISQFEGI